MQRRVETTRQPLTTEWLGGGPAGWARRLVLWRLRSIERGRLLIFDGPYRHELGREDASFPVTGRLRIEDGEFWERVAWGGSIGAAEAFRDGLWSSPDLTAVVRVLARNRAPLERLERGTAALLAPLRRAAHRLRSNTRGGSRRNIAAHYDSGNQLFAQFLDRSLVYSCGIYPDATSSLETAQEWKLDAVCRKLELQRGERLLEIGTGWGALALHAARKYGCRVVTTTLSERQFDYASAAAHEAGLADRIEVIRRDYRDLPALIENGEPRFDKLASIEMIEAVGHAHLPRYLEIIDRLLEPHGLALLQAILVPDQRYDAYRRSVDFIQRHVFPGGHLPSLARILQCTSSSTSLALVDIEDLTPHYARTLRDWRSRFEANEVAIRDLGLEGSERRMWKYYFSYCEAAFLERAVADVQLLFAKPESRRQLTLRRTS